VDTRAGSSSPQQAVSLRTAGDREIDLIDSSRNETVASLARVRGRAPRRAPGSDLPPAGPNLRGHESRPRPRCGELQSSWADYYTQPLTEKDIVVNADLGERELSARPDVPVRFADVTVTEQITGFVRKDTATGESLGESVLDLPETTLRTKALYFPVPGTSSPRCARARGP